MQETPSFCIVGAGAMGSLYGGRLAQAGFQVTLVDTWREHIEAIATAGLHLDHESQTETISVTATIDSSDVEPVDVAIIYVNANSTADAAVKVAGILRDDGIALTLQNGVGNREALTSVLGEHRVMCGLSYASAAVMAPGHTTHTHEGPTWIGEWDGSKSHRLLTLSSAFERARLRPIVVDDIEALIWDKWILNSAINALCAITGLRQGEIPRTPSVELMQDKILDELFAIAAARSIRLSDVDLRDSIKDQCWKKFNKPSMLQHMEAGKTTEIDALNGAAVRLGRECGVATPYNEALTLLIKGRERARSNELLAEIPDYHALEAEAATGKRSHT